MSFESPNSNPTPFDRSPEAMEAAADLVAENEVLRDNPRVQALLENDFVTEDGRELDPGNFLSSMLDFIASQEAVTPEELEAAMDKYTVDANLNVEVHRRDEGAQEATE